MPDVTITPSEDGPYLVSGPCRLTDVDGREIPHQDQMSLCRCGQSGNKPFCDGTHLTVDVDSALAELAYALDDLRLDGVVLFSNACGI